MKPIPKTNLKSLPVLILCTVFLLCNSHSVQAALNNKSLQDSSLHSSKTREILLSQQLFTVKVSKPKSKKAKPGVVDFKAELRDAFTIICYDKDKSYTELDWTMCPDGKCPISGTCRFGSAKYKQLDTLIANTKLANIKAMKQLKALVASTKKRK